MGRWVNRDASDPLAQEGHGDPQKVHPSLCPAWGGPGLCGAAQVTGLEGKILPEHPCALGPSRVELGQRSGLDGLIKQTYLVLNMQRTVRCWVSQPRLPPLLVRVHLATSRPGWSATPQARSWLPSGPQGNKSTCTWKGKGRPEGPGKGPCPLWAPEDLLFLENVLQGLASARPTVTGPWSWGT